VQNLAGIDSTTASSQTKDRMRESRNTVFALTQLFRRIRAAWHEETGDVPGWVLITLMTAGLVIVIWGLAGPALSGVFEQAISRVTSF
jgi:hypothetical protein